MLAQLKANGFTLAVATSKPVEFARRVTDYFNLTQYFTYITGPDFNGSLPTKADVIADALKHFGLAGAAKAQACVTVMPRPANLKKQAPILPALRRRML